MSIRNDAEKRLVDYRRAMHRASLVSLFWVVIEHKRETNKYTLSALAKKIGRHKSALSRWFSDERPNWTSDTVADIAGALGIEILVSARDKATGTIFTPQGLISSSAASHPKNDSTTADSDFDVVKLKIMCLPPGSEDIAQREATGG